MYSRNSIANQLPGLIDRPFNPNFLGFSIIIAFFYGNYQLFRYVDMKDLWEQFYVFFGYDGLDPGKDWDCNAGFTTALHKFKIFLVVETGPARRDVALVAIARLDQHVYARGR